MYCWRFNAWMNGLRKRDACCKRFSWLRRSSSTTWNVPNYEVSYVASKYGVFLAATKAKLQLPRGNAPPNACDGNRQTRQTDHRYATRFRNRLTCNDDVHICAAGE